MNWRLENACALDIHNYDIPKKTVVRVNLIADVLDRFCIGLCLLNEDLIDSLDLVDTNSFGLFSLRRPTHAMSIDMQPDKISVVLDAIELERWGQFTLRAVRDGAAEVDHLDVTVMSTDELRHWVDLVIVYSSSVPPVSPDEARRRLGL
jgi:hypothetical protein